MNKWRAVYSESCKYGSGASVGKPNLVIGQGVWHLAYSIQFRLWMDIGIIVTDIILQNLDIYQMKFVKNMG